MIQALLLAIVCLGLYGVFLLLRGMVRLWQNREKKLLFCAAAAAVLLPAVFLLILFSVPEGKMSIWFALPAALLVFAFLSLGYFLETYLRREKQLLQEGRKRVILARPAHSLRNNLLLLAGSLALWSTGAFLSIKNAMLETILLCTAIFLFIRSLATLWKYRGF